MADMETMLEWAGYDSWIALLDDKLTEIDKIELLWEILIMHKDIAHELVSDILDDMGFVDEEQVRADYEDAKMQEWKDKRRGID